MRHDIHAGTYPAGSKIPTEAALAGRFGVNRHTVRRALGYLADQGLVFSRRGAGVFVVEQVTEYPIGKRVRFHHNLEAAGKIPGKEALSTELRRGTREECGELGLVPQSMVQVYDGLSYADNVPIALFRSVFPAHIEGLIPALEELGSVTRALAQCGVGDYTRENTRISARLATATQASLLQVKEGEPLVLSKSVNVDGGGVPLEFGTTWFVGERVTLTIGG